jgi:Flp pilus assembly protein TadG
LTRLVARGIYRRGLRPGSDDGSAAILIPIGALLFVTATTLSVDVGLFLNDRRDAQATVDAMALAGALELTLNGTDDAAVRVNAEDRAEEWGTANGLDLSDPDLDWDVEVVRNCYSANDGVYTGVRVTITRSPMSALLDYFGASWRSGATALACAGRPVEERGYLPFAVSEVGPCFTLVGGQYKPKVGERCNLQVSNSAALNGQLGLDPDGNCDDGNPSASELQTNIINGVPVDCRVGDSVKAGPGNSVGQVRAGMSARLASGHPCDSNPLVTEAQLDASTATIAAQGYTPLAPANKNNSIDDLFEVWERNVASGNSGDNLIPYDYDSVTAGSQTSPRNVNIIVVHDWSDDDGAGSQFYIVRGFVRMYIEGCARNGTFYPDCDMGGGDFEIWGRMVEQFGENNSVLGLSNYGDIGVYLKE